MAAAAAREASRSEALFVQALERENYPKKNQVEEFRAARQLCRVAGV